MRWSSPALAARTGACEPAALRACSFAGERAGRQGRRGGGQARWRWCQAELAECVAAWKLAGGGLRLDAPPKTQEYFLGALLTPLLPHTAGCWLTWAWSRGCRGWTRHTTACWQQCATGREHRALTVPWATAPLSGGQGDGDGGRPAFGMGLVSGYPRGQLLRESDSLSEIKREREKSANDTPYGPVFVKPCACAPIWAWLPFPSCFSVYIFSGLWIRQNACTC